MKLGRGTPSLLVRAGAIVISVVLPLLAACGGGSDDSAATGEARGGGEAAGDAGTAERDSAAAAAATRLSKLRQDITALQEGAEAEDELPSDQVASLTALAGRLDEADRSISTLRTATPEGWQDAKAAADRTLVDIESSFSQLRGALEGERTRLEAERREREEKRRQEIRATGLVTGMDDEDYAICSEATVKKVQQALKDKGLYKGEVTGHLSERTMKGVAAFQEQTGLWATGVPTPLTRSWLFGEITADEPV